MATIRAAGVAGQQWGVIGRAQLLGCGVSRHMITTWCNNGRLHPLIPAVYALGHAAVGDEGWLVAALLHAGPGSALSHATAAWWWGLISEQPQQIHVSTTGHARSTGRIRVHRPDILTPTRHRRFPITPVARTLRDFATQASYSAIRQALSEADYRQLLDLDEVRNELGSGRTGSGRLRKALEHHEPRLARTRSVLERLFLSICERHHVPLPDFNVKIGRMTVDAVWPAERVVVEIDSPRAHGSRARITRDRRRELHLRAAGFLVLRYSDDQLQQEPEAVAADILATLAAQRAGRASL